MNLLVAGWSVRSLACSLYDAGYSVTAADAYYDADLRIRGIPTISIREACRHHTDFDALLYGSSVEELLKFFPGRIFGNSAKTIRNLSDVRTWFAFLDRAGIHYPRTWFSASELPSGVEVLLKNPSRHGGAGVRPWKGDNIPRGNLLQEKIDAISYSASFFATKGDATLLGVTEHVGFERDVRTTLNVPGYAYCGNILLRDWKKKILDRLSDIARSLTQEYNLVGLNGIDFIMTENEEPLLLEINPRWCASFELLERVPGFVPAVSQIKGKLPPITELPIGAVGKAVLYAPETGVNAPPDSLEWLQEGIVDVPMPGEIIKPLHPLCTVIAEGETRDACLSALLAKAVKLYERLEKNDGR
ncbi:MAG TPA: ATP-grasp domain-containing protein [Oscillospiraceae bacterium]|nr:ATP-grasp domain-containing protein [Oscillospiraceae bacterium]